MVLQQCQHSLPVVSRHFVSHIPFDERKVPVNLPIRSKSQHWLIARTQSIALLLQRAHKTPRARVIVASVEGKHPFSIFHRRLPSRIGTLRLRKHSAELDINHAYIDDINIAKAVIELRNPIKQEQRVAMGTS